MRLYLVRGSAWSEGNAGFSITKSRWFKRRPDAEKWRDRELWRDDAEPPELKAVNVPTKADDLALWLYRRGVHY